MNIHPKTAGASLGAAIGVLVVTILSSIHGVHLTTATDASITAFLSIVASWFAPSQQTVPVAVTVHPTPTVTPTPIKPANVNSPVEAPLQP